MVYLAALASSALYGAADFLGGLASKRASTAWVVAISQAAGLLVLLAAVGLLPAADPYAADCCGVRPPGWPARSAWACCTAPWPSAPWAWWRPSPPCAPWRFRCSSASSRGQRPAPLALTGIVLAMVAIVLVSQQPPGHSRPGQRPPLAAGCRLACRTRCCRASPSACSSSCWPRPGRNPACGRSSARAAAALPVLPAGRARWAAARRCA